MQIDALTNPFIDPSLLQAAVAAMHEHNRNPDQQQLFNVAVTGAAAGVLALVTSVAGASRTFFGGSVPYHPAASAAFVGHKIAKATARKTAIALAESARRQAYDALEHFETGTQPTINGLGLTAAIATDRRRKGADVVYIALATSAGIFVIEAVFARESWTREEQDLMCQALAINAMLFALGLPQVPIAETPSTKGFFSCEKAYLDQNIEGRRFTLRPTRWLPAFETEITADELFEQPFFALNGERYPFIPENHGRYCEIGTSGRPLTEGHLWLGDTMCALEDLEPIYTLERQHPDKGPVAIDELARRAYEFRGRANLLLTDGESFYADKARNRPGMIFVIGADVAEKLLSPQNPRRDADLAIIREHGCTFRVFPRWKSDGTLERLTDVEHRLGVTADPAIFTHVESVPPPVSSTVVRAALGI